MWQMPLLLLSLITVDMRSADHHIATAALPRWPKERGSFFVRALATGWASTTGGNGNHWALQGSQHCRHRGRTSLTHGPPPGGGGRGGRRFSEGSWSRSGGWRAHAHRPSGSHGEFWFITDGSAGSIVGSELFVAKRSLTREFSPSGSGVHQAVQKELLRWGHLG